MADVRLLTAFALVVCLGCGSRPARPAPDEVQATAPPLPPPPALRLGGLTGYATVIGERYDAERAFETVSIADRYFRVRGNEGYQKTLDRVAAQLRAGGFDEAHLHRLELGPVQPTWTPVSAHLDLVTADGLEPVLGFDHEADVDRGALMVGSASVERRRFALFRRPAGALGALVDGRVGDRRLTGHDVVLGTGHPRAALDPLLRDVFRGELLWVPAAAGELHPPDERASTFSYLPPRGSGRFGFALGRAPYRRLDAALAGGRPVEVEVQIEVRRGRSAASAIEARIDGSDPSLGAIVFVAHADEPGAVDNASGVGCLAELARALRAAIEAGELPRPAHPLVFLWGQEIEVTREWLARQATRPAAGIAFDMVGASPEVVGAPLLVERMPDPGGMFPDPRWDEPSGWGPAGRATERRPGHFVADYAVAAVAAVAAAAVDAGEPELAWRAHPFEGGSDHEPLLEAGVPALLAWHFPDAAYHTHLDRLDRVSATQMERVARAFGAWATGLASRSVEDGRDALAALEHLALRRVDAPARAVPLWEAHVDEALARLTDWYPEIADEAEAASARIDEAFRLADSVP